MPIDCVLGDSCYIQNYVDHDPTHGLRDHACNAATYDGHTGTDFALNNFASLEQNFEVRAAHAGIVLGTRNTVPDIATNAPDAPDLQGQDCGNGVTLAHGNGVQTQYCHMAQGTVVVKSGDTVEQGDPLGFVGLSGNTEFPHLHFELRQNDRIIDPFQPQAATSCDVQPPLWEPNVIASAGGIISNGVATSIPAYSQVLAGLPDVTTIAPMPPAIVSWALLYNAQENDVIHFEITSGDQTLMTEKTTLEKDQARVYRAMGKRAPTASEKWPNGAYSNRVTVLRDGNILDQKTTPFRIEP